jgi:hypothetical protein
VAPLLFTLLFGIVDYGLYFADRLTVQQGLDDAARSATLAPSGVTGPQWGTASCPVQLDAALGASLTPVACGVLDRVKPLAGEVYVRAELVDAAGQPALTWATGHRLRLCALTDHSPVMPLVPLPSGGEIRTRVDMPVQAVPVEVPLAPVQSLLPAGGDWSWC